MKPIRLRARFNPENHGIALSKLGKQVSALDGFLRSIIKDIGEEDSPNSWRAYNFKNGSVFTTAEFNAVSNIESNSKFNLAVDFFTAFSDKKQIRPPDFLHVRTLDKFSSLCQSLDDEKMGLATYNEKTGKQNVFKFIDKSISKKIEQLFESDISYYGSIMGYTHSWNKGTERPFFVIREINTGELIQCAYSDDNYRSVANIFSKKTAVVIIEGSMRYNKVLEKTEILSSESFEFAPAYEQGDLDAFFGCAPGMTGNYSSEDFVSQGRCDD